MNYHKDLGESGRGICCGATASLKFIRHHDQPLVEMINSTHGGMY